MDYLQKVLDEDIIKLVDPIGGPTICINEYLDSSTGLIDAINEYGRKRGQYQKGSNKNPVTGTGGKVKKPDESKEPETEEN